MFVKEQTPRYFVILFVIHIDTQLFIIPATAFISYFRLDNASVDADKYDLWDLLKFN